MKDRDCETCLHAHPFGGETDNRCDAWECEYINRKEAIEAYKARRDDPLIEIVRCGECKWFIDDGWGFGGCERPFVGHLRTAVYDFCSYGERRADETN